MTLSGQGLFALGPSDEVQAARPGEVLPGLRVTVTGPTLGVTDCHVGIGDGGGVLAFTVKVGRMRPALRKRRPCLLNASTAGRRARIGDRDPVPADPSRLAHPVRPGGAGGGLDWGPLGRYLAQEARSPAPAAAVEVSGSDRCRPVSSPGNILSSPWPSPQSCLNDWSSSPQVPGGCSGTRFADMSPRDLQTPSMWDWRPDSSGEAPLSRSSSPGFSPAGPVDCQGAGGLGARNPEEPLQGLLLVAVERSSSSGSGGYGISEVVQVPLVTDAFLQQLALRVDPTSMPALLADMVMLATLALDPYLGRIQLADALAAHLAGSASDLGLHSLLHWVDSVQRLAGAEQGLEAEAPAGVALVSVPPGPIPGSCLDPAADRYARGPLLDFRDARIESEYRQASVVRWRNTSIIAWCLRQLLYIMASRHHDADLIAGPSRRPMGPYRNHR